MRKIDEIIVHCTATKAGQSFDVEDVRRWHLQRNFRDIGYHFLVLLDGTVQQGRTIAEVGAHCTGHNTRSIGVCYVADLPQAALRRTRAHLNNAKPCAICLLTSSDSSQKRLSTDTATLPTKPVRVSMPPKSIKTYEKTGILPMFERPFLLMQRKEERGYHHARTDPSDRLAYQYASPFVVWLYSPNA